MGPVDWQTLSAIALVAVAAAWWVRRARRWARGSDAGCGTGCGSCSDGGPSAPPAVIGTDELERFPGGERK